MLKYLIEEAVKVDLEPKLASLWWKSNNASEEKEHMILGTSKGCYKFSFEDEFKILGCVLNRPGKTCNAVEERMQSANKAFKKDIKISKSKDVLWRVKCQRLVDQVFAVFSFGSETWSWTADIVKHEAWVEYHTRTCIMARKIWVQMKLPFLYE